LPRRRHRMLDMKQHASCNHHSCRIEQRSLCRIGRVPGLHRTALSCKILADWIFGRLTAYWRTVPSPGLSAMVCSVGPWPACPGAAVEDDGLAANLNFTNGIQQLFEQPINDVSDKKPEECCHEATDRCALQPIRNSGPHPYRRVECCESGQQSENCAVQDGP